MKKDLPKKKLIIIFVTVLCFITPLFPIVTIDNPLINEYSEELFWYVEDINEEIGDEDIEKVANEFKALLSFWSDYSSDTIEDTGDYVEAVLKKAKVLCKNLTSALEDLKMSQSEINTIASGLSSISSRTKRFYRQNPELCNELVEDVGLDNTSIVFKIGTYSAFVNAVCFIRTVACLATIVMVLITNKKKYSIVSQGIAFAADVAFLIGCSSAISYANTEMPGVFQISILGALGSMLPIVPILLILSDREYEMTTIIENAKINTIKSNLTKTVNDVSGEISTSIKCPTCGKLNGPFAKYCTSCGSKMTETKINTFSVKSFVTTCPNCGRENSAGSKFCVYCGAQLTKATETEGKPVAVSTIEPIKTATEESHGLKSTFKNAEPTFENKKVEEKKTEAKSDNKTDFFHSADEL